MYSKGLFEARIGDIRINMEPQWYPSYSTERGRGWLIYLFKEGPIKGQYLIFSKLEKGKVSDEIIFQIINKKNMNISNTSRTKIGFKNGSIEILELQGANDGMEDEIHFKIARYNLAGVASSFESLEEILDVERIE